MASARRYSSGGQVADDVRQQILLQLKALGIKIPMGNGTSAMLPDAEVADILERVAAIGWVASLFGLAQAANNPPTHGRGQGVVSPSQNRALTDAEFAELQQLFAEVFPN